MSTYQIIPVKDYNATQVSRHMKIQNEDGSLKKTGFVVSNGDNAAYFKKHSDAVVFLQDPTFEEVEYMTLESRINN